MQQKSWMNRWVIAVAFGILAPFVSGNEAATGAAPGGEAVHLVILSGQSNMAGLKPEISFIPEFQNGFGGEEVVFVKDAMGGQPIRRWIPGWKDASGKTYSPTGDLYTRLVGKVKLALAERGVQSLTFVWMQGERDARESHAKVYAKSLGTLVNQLVKEDFGRKDIKVVIGRLSDFDMQNARYPHWTQIRAAQVSYADTHANTVWVDTDDLNGDKDDLHYDKPGYRDLGLRFARAALKLHGKYHKD